MTATTGRTVLALIAILSLVLSVFAIARPVIANHDNGVPEVTPTTEAFPGGDPTCDGANETAVRFGEGPPDDDAVLEAGSSFEVLLTDGSTATVTILSLDDDRLTFEVENGLAAVVKVKGGVATVDDVNVYDYTGSLEFPGPGIAHDDGLRTPSGTGISHVDFCLIPVDASIIVYKTDQTGADVADAEFTVFDGETPVAGPASTGSDGLVCFDGLVLDKVYTVVETDTPDGWLPADPDNQTHEAVQGDCEEREGAESDLTFTNTLLGSLLVWKTDGEGAALDGATFTIRDESDAVVTTATSGDDGTGLFCLDGLIFDHTYEVTEDAAPAGFTPDLDNPQSHTIDVADDCATRLAASELDPDLTFVNEEGTGSITVVKELDCEICNAETPGFFFNVGGGGPGVEFAQASLDADPIVVGGVSYDYDTALEAFGPPPGAGALIIQYLALELNVRYAAENAECDLGSLVYAGDNEDFAGMTVNDILALAAAQLNGEETGFSDEEIKDVLDEINDSTPGDGTLECLGEDVVDEFTFEVFLDDVSVGTISSGETLDGLAFGTYTIVETSPDGLDCTIVEVEGGTLNPDGSVTVVVSAETPDVIVTVVNECEEEQADEVGDITIIKETDEDEPSASFAFSASWDGDGFWLMDGDIEWSGLILAGQDYVVTEELTAEQIAAGWSLVDIDCGEATVVVEGSSVTITLGADESIVCTFTNEQELDEGEGLVEIDKLFCFTDDEASTEFFVFGPIELPQFDALGQVEEELPEEGCWTEAVSFTITGGELTEPLEVTTGDNGSLEFTLPASEDAYTITEDLSGESTEFFVADGEFTAIVVLNLVPEEEAGLVKVIKLFCEGDEATVEFIVEGNTNADVPVISGCEVGDATFELGDMEIVTEDGIALVLVEAGDYSFAETDPTAAEYDGLITVVEGEITTIIVINTFVEDEQSGGGGGTAPGGEGTLGGNPLPNTSTSPIPTGSLPAGLLALVMLTGLGAAGYAMQAEARRRR